MRDIELMKERWRKWGKGEVSSASLLLSATPLQASRPISLAVGENEHYAYVLSHPEDSRPGRFSSPFLRPTLDTQGR